MNDSGVNAVRALCVTSPAVTDRLRDVVADTPLSPAVTALGSVADFVAALDSTETVDCVLTAYDLPDGSASDVCEALAARHADVPTVLLVEPTDGCVPAAALSDEFAACLPTANGVPSHEDLTDAFETVLGDDLSLIGPDADDWQTDAWKANVLSQLFEKLPLHVYVKDRDARIVFVTEGPVDGRIHPLADEFSGKRDIDGVVPLDEAIGPYLDDRDVIETGDSIVDKEEFFDSTDRWFVTSKVPLHDESGAVVGLIGVAREVTERKEYERQLSALNHLLRHNLRTDVNIIQGWAEQLHERADAPLDECTERLVRAASRLHSTVENQQDLVDVVTRPVSPVTVDAARAVRIVYDDLTEQFPDVRFERTIPDTVSVRASGRFDRAVVELMENSVVHNPRDDRYVGVSVEREGDVVRISVADNGPPIPEAEVAILTGRREIDPLSHSTGLGLWLVDWIARRSGGSLSFAERDPRGNVVTLTLAADD